MKKEFFVVIFLLVITFELKAQLRKTDMCEFSVKLYERKITNYGYGNPKIPGTFSISVGNYTYIGTDAISNYFMQQAFQDFNPNTVKQRFGNLCGSATDFERFIYQILIECEGKQQSFNNLIFAFCGNRTLASKFYNHLIIRYGKKLLSDIEKLKNKDRAEDFIDDKKSVNFIKTDSSRLDTSLAVFPGGDVAWQNFLIKNFRYPDEAVNREIQGTVIIEFTIDTAGNPINIHAVNGQEILCKEGIDIINRTTWIPATVGNRKVQTVKRQSIIFKLQDQ